MVKEGRLGPSKGLESKVTPFIGRLGQLTGKGERASKKKADITRHPTTEEKYEKQLIGQRGWRSRGSSTATASRASSSWSSASREETEAWGSTNSPKAGTRRGTSAGSRPPRERPGRRRALTRT